MLHKDNLRIIASFFTMEAVIFPCHTERCRGWKQYFLSESALVSAGRIRPQTIIGQNELDELDELE